MKSVTSTSIKLRRVLNSLGIATAMLLTTTTASALSTSYYTSESKLSAGKWVKIKTSGEGIHQITYDQLRQWGFTNPERVNVYGYGATLLSSDKFQLSDPDDVALTYTHHEGNKLFFYSTADVSVRVTSNTALTTQRNYYSTDVYYLLGDREVGEGESAAKAPLVAGQAPTNAHVSVTLVENELQNPSLAGAYFLGEDIPVDGGVDIPMDVTNMGVGNSGWKNTATLRVGFAAKIAYPTILRLKAPADITSHTTTSTPATFTFRPEYERYKVGYTTMTINQTIADGTHVFSALHPNEGQEFMAIDYAWMMYPRLSKMGDLAQLSMYFPGVKATKNFTLEGSQTVRVINVTNISAIHEHQTSYVTALKQHTGSFDADYSLTASPSCHLVAYDVNKPQMEVEFAGEVANQNLHGHDTPDMIIITTKPLVEAAENLADLHRRHDGMDVLVVEHSSLFNEFSSATPDIMGYRRFIKMLYDRNPSKLKYVLMYGTSYWDNRSITVDKKDRLLVYETTNDAYSSNVTTAFGSDCYLGMLNDRFDPTPTQFIKTRQDIAVGRIPVEDAVQAYGVNRKIAAYMTGASTTAMYNTALVLSDDGDNNIHLNQAEEVASLLQESHPAISIVRAHNSTFQWDNNDARNLRTVAINALNRGVGLYVYVGHGNEEGFGAEAIWNRFHNTTNSYTNHPFGFLATCSAFAFDSGNDNIGQAMILKEDGGLIGVIAAGRVVFGTSNHHLSKSAAQYYATAPTGTTLGQLWLEARNNLLSLPANVYGEDPQLNTMCFNLGGDPALKLATPQYRVELTEFNGKPVDEYPGDKIEINPRVLTTMAGRIVDFDGNTVEDFNGTVTIQLYDGAYTIRTLQRKSDDVVQDILLDQDILSTKTVVVTDGQFETSFIAPVPVREYESNRLTFHADAEDGRRGDALYTNFAVYTTSEQTDEYQGFNPTIDNLAVRQLDPTSISLNATGMVDISGLNNSSSIGSASSLVIDGNNHIAGIKEAIRMSPDNMEWTLNVTVPDLETGNHSATLTIVDNIGNRTSRTVEFLIGDNNNVILTADVATVRDLVTFDVEHSLGQVNDCRLVIEDRMGNTVLNRLNPAFPCTVDLSQIEDMENGHYKAFVQMKGTDGNGSSAHLPLVLIRR